jgi:predicted transcriptional regulator
VGTNIKNLKALLGSLTEKGINKNDSFRNRQFKVTEAQLKS